jgi:hypothetical protein
MTCGLGPAGAFENRDRVCQSCGHASFLSARPVPAAAKGDFVQDRLARFAQVEKRDGIAWVWADRIAAGVLKKRIGTPAQQLAGTVHLAGHLQAVVEYLWLMAHTPCSCVEYWKRDQLNLPPDERHEITDEDHQCAPFQAQRLLELLQREAQPPAGAAQFVSPKAAVDLEEQVRQITQVAQAIGNTMQKLQEMQADQERRRAEAERRRWLPWIYRPRKEDDE